MDKEEFIDAQSSKGIDKDLARTAWDNADGEVEDAEELLGIEKLNIKSSLHEPEKNFTGYFGIEWDISKERIKTLESVMVSSDGSDEISPHTSWRQFLNELSELSQTGQRMGGYSNELKQGLEEFFQDENSSIREVISEENFDTLSDTFEEFFNESFDFNNVQIQLDYDLERKIASDDGESPSGAPDEEIDLDEERDEEIVFSCSTDINPIRGVPVTDLSPGDEIYVNIKEVDPDEKPIKSKLEEESNEGGFVSARIETKKVNDAGNINMRVQFGKNVYGELNCGRDVSILVPDDTKNSLTDSSGGFLDGVDDKVIVGVMVVGILLVLGLAWFLLM